MAFVMVLLAAMLLFYAIYFFDEKTRKDDAIDADKETKGKENHDTK